MLCIYHKSHSAYRSWLIHHIGYSFEHRVTPEVLTVHTLDRLILYFFQVGYNKHRLALSEKLLCFGVNTSENIYSVKLCVLGLRYGCKLILICYICTLNAELQCKISYFIHVRDNSTDLCNIKIVFSVQCKVL